MTDITIPQTQVVLEADALTVPLKGYDELPEGAIRVIRETEDVFTHQVQWVRIADIQPTHPVKGAGQLKQVSDRILSEGFDPHQAIRLAQDGDILRVIQGHHRLASVWHAGYDYIPAVVIHQPSNISILDLQTEAILKRLANEPERFFRQVEKIRGPRITR